jgi:hypothetical protein
MTLNNSSSSSSTSAERVVNPSSGYSEGGYLEMVAVMKLPGRFIVAICRANTGDEKQAGI